MLNAAGDKSFVDDLAASGYCKCESSLCCYEALRFIPCFYDLFFFVFKISKRASMVCRIFARGRNVVCQKPTSPLYEHQNGAFLPELLPGSGTQQSSALLDNLEITPSARPDNLAFCFFLDLML